MQTRDNSVDQKPVAAAGDFNQKSAVTALALRSTDTAADVAAADADANVNTHADTDAAYKLLSKRFMREHLLRRTVSWTTWMLLIGVAFAATTVWLLFPS